MELKCCFILWITFTSNMAWGHIPMRYFNSAEPDAPIYVPDPTVSKLSRQTAYDRLTAVRRVMSDRRVDAYIVPTADAHNSQYISPADARREWLSGLQGSSGTALVTATGALLWTDARYFTQFYVQVDTTQWDLMRQGTDVAITEWLVDNLPAGAVVGIDPTTYTRNNWTPLENALAQANISLLATPDNLVDIARVNITDGPPDRPSNDLLPLTTNYTGRPASEKIGELVSQMHDRNASVLILTALDEVAYTLNLRGSDIPFNPVFFAYLLIRSDVNAPNNIVFFWNDGQIASEVIQHLATENLQVQTRPYTEIFQYLRILSGELPHGSGVWLPEDASHAIYLAVENDGDEHGLNILSTVSPVALMKVVKNQVELQGFRNAHVKDGVAVIRSLFWIHQQVDAGVNVTEVQLSDKMRDFRAEEEDSMGPSFATIAGAGANGAIIHYKPNENDQTVISRQDMLLVDSGGQYKDGTTDITRTRHMSASPTAAQRRAFTRVLKGQINLGTAVFPLGTQGHVIEVLARKALWDVGLNYGHGTGHGVGHFLNVHEGPTWILSGPAANDPGIRPNMIYSNEPGYYEVDEYGIRHEDLVETISITRDADHPLADGMVADFEGRGVVGFHTISLAPHQTACLDVGLLTDFEIKYINDYHARVLSIIGPILLDRGYTDEFAWLERECAPIGRNAAILFALSPILTAVSVIKMFL